MSKVRGYWPHRERWRRVTKLMARDGSDCTICHLPLDRSVRDPHDPSYITFDHVVPRSQLADDRLPNLRLAHRRCNEERGCDPVTDERELWRSEL